MGCYYVALEDRIGLLVMCNKLKVVTGIFHQTQGAHPCSYGSDWRWWTSVRTVEIRQFEIVNVA
jgi:hypothetical protein